MKKIRNKNAKPITILITLSALLALSGMAAIVSADEPPVVNIFRGTVSVDGKYVESGTITAYFNGNLSGSSEITMPQWYYIGVTGDPSDSGVITFEINGALADQTPMWETSTQPAITRDLNLSRGELPTYSPDPIPTPTSNGGDTSGGFGGSTTTTGTDTSTSDESAVAGDGATAPTTTTAETATTSSTEETPGTDDDAEPEERSFPWFVVLVIAGLLVVAIIAYLAKKR